MGSQSLRGGGVALFLLAAYLLSYSGVYHAADELSTLQVAESLLADGSLQVNEMEWEQTWLPSQNTWGVDGNLYSKKGIGLSLVELPFLAIGKLFPGTGAVALTLLAGSILSAAAGWLLFSATQLAGFGTGAGVLTALAWGFATPAWTYAHTLFSEPLAALGVALGIHGCLGFRWRSGSAGLRWLLEVSSGAAIMLLAKPALGFVAGVFFPFIGYYLVIEYRRSRRSGWHMLRQCLLASLPAVAALALTLGLNYHHYHTFFSYPITDPSEGFITPLLTGLRGLLISPGKGLLWYAPLAWLAPFALHRWSKRDDRPVLFLLAGIILANILLFATWSDWAGGRAWGPRMVVPALPGVVMLVAPLVGKLTDRRALAWQRALIAVVLLASFIVQIPGVLVNFDRQEALDVAAGATPDQLLWSWLHSPLRTYWDAIGSATTNPLLLQPFLKSSGVWAPTAALLLLLAAGITSLHGIFGQRPRRWTLAAGAGCACLAALLLVQIAGSDPRWSDGVTNRSDNQQVLSFLRSQTGESSAVLLDLDPYANITGRAWWWINSSDLHPRAVGWRRRDVVTEEDRAILSSWLERYDRVWLLQATTMPNGQVSATEQILDRIGVRGDETWLGTQRLVAYEMPRHPVDVPIGTDATGSVQFGDRLTLAGYEVFAREEPDTYAVHLHWSGNTPADWHYSVQAITADGVLSQQSDGPIGGLPEGDGYVDRVSLVVPDGCRLILKIYDFESGEVQLLTAPQDLTDESLLTLRQVDGHPVS